MRNFYDITEDIRSGITIDDLWAEYSEYATDFCEVEGEKIPTVLRIPIADCFKHYIKKHADREMLYCSPFREFDIFMSPYGYAGVCDAKTEDGEEPFDVCMYNSNTPLRIILQHLLHEVKQRYTAMLCQVIKMQDEDRFLGIPKSDYRWEFFKRNVDKYGIECYIDPDDEEEHIYVGKIEKEWI